MITAAYLDQQQKLHAKGNYGVSGHKYAKMVSQLADQFQTTDILDYGCGNRTLESALGFLIRNYDPAIPEFAESPKYPADLVACTDVLEHVEPEFIDSVIADIRRLTRKITLLVVATGPAHKTLDDGRNAHLTQQNERFWLPKITEHFKLLSFKNLGAEFAVIGVPR